MGAWGGRVRRSGERGLGKGRGEDGLNKMEGVACGGGSSSRNQLGCLPDKVLSNFSLQKSLTFSTPSHPPHSSPRPHAPPAYSPALSSTSHFPASVPIDFFLLPPAPSSYPHVGDFSELHPQLYVVIVSTLTSNFQAPSTSPSPPPQLHISPTLLTSSPPFLPPSPSQCRCSSPMQPRPGT